jgi:hypothetical protein
MMMTARLSLRLTPNIYRWLVTRLLLITALLLPLSSAAHVMVAEHGTLRFQPKGVYFLASVSSRVFHKFDDDHDQKLSEVEFKKHYQELIVLINQTVNLVDDGYPLSLEGLILNLSRPHGDHGPAPQIVIMGRFPSPTKSKKIGDLILRTLLFKQTKYDSYLKVKVSKGSHVQNLIINEKSTEIDISQVYLSSK